MKQRVRLWLPILVSFLLIVVLVSYAPWKQIFHVLSDFDLGTIFVLIGLSLAYYGLKALRFWYILQAISVKQPFGVVAISYLSAQPISLLPAGEIYRSHALRRYTGVPVERSIGQFTLQGVLEGTAMALLMLISALTLGTLRLVAIILSVVVIAVLILIKMGTFEPAGQLANHLPFINITEKSIEQFSHRNRQALSRQWLPWLFGLSVIVELVGTAIAYTAMVGIGGHINIFEAAFLYIIPIIVGFISFLPGGLGISEQSAIGVLLLGHTPIAIAIAATLIMRVTIVGLGVVYGLVAGLAATLRLQPVRADRSTA